MPVVALVAVAAAAGVVRCALTGVEGVEIVGVGGARDACAGAGVLCEYCGTNLGEAGPPPNIE